MKTQPLKGMRDLLPREQALRDYIQGQILATYRAAGFQRISNLPQGCVGAAVGPGAAINQQNFHVYACLPLRYLHDTPPQVPMQAEKWEDFAAGCDSDKKEWAVSL